MSMERNGHTSEPKTARSNGHHSPDQDESTFEVPEMGGSEADEFIDDSAEGGNHQAVLSPDYRSAAIEADEETEVDESTYESVEGWSEPTAQESGDETGDEALMDAYFAEAGEQEFLPLVGALIPMLKTVLPALVAKAAPNIVNRLSARARQRFLRLRALARGAGLESDGEASAAEEAALVAALEQAEVVIGTDDRVQVQDTKPVPWRRICHLRIQAANGRAFLGTGFLVAPRTVITAGHCVFMKSQGGWARRITVSPGRNGSATPFGKVDAVTFRSVRGWVDSHKREYDYGAIILPRTMAVPVTVGAFGFANFSTAQLAKRKLNTAGYPGDKHAGSMWFMGRKAKQITPRTLVYEIDTAGGQSGSAVWVNLRGKRTVVGIHTNGSSAGNSATRITRPVYDNIKRWSGEGGRQVAPLAHEKPAAQRQQTAYEDQPSV